MLVITMGRPGTCPQPNYWGEAPDVDSFSIKYIPDNDAKILAMQNGEVDFLSGIKNISAESFEQMEQTEGFHAQADEKSLQTYYVGYNLSDPIFGDQIVREAISSAIDKDAIVESIYGGLYDKQIPSFPATCPIVMWSRRYIILTWTTPIRFWMKRAMPIPMATVFVRRTV